MGLIEGMVSGFLQSISLVVLPYLIVGAVFGLIIGVIPGLSGHFAMAMAVTFLYSMEPEAGIAFLLGTHATVAQGGAITAILFSIPGTAQNAATMLDGPAMRDRGEAGVAVGAAMTSCFLGAAFGAITLALMIPVLREVVLVFGPSEIVVLVFLALTFVAVLGKEDLIRGLIAALLGLLLAMVGLDNVTNTERFTFGADSLRDGLSLVPVVLGLFAVAEMISLWTDGGPLANDQRQTLSSRQLQQQIFRGVIAALRRWWLVLRCSAIGTLMGLIPGLGSAPASFVAYGHAKQTSKSKKTFGRGNIEGVIGPEAANDAVEGGALASTIAFGIPGSSSMAILLSGLFVLGLETGPEMLNNHVDIIFIMIFTIIIGNLIGTAIGVFLYNPVSRAAEFRASVLVPVLIAIIVTGAYAAERSLFDIGVALAFGFFGYFMKYLNYSRSALLIGFVLGFMLEKNLYLALVLDGPLFFTDPIPLALAFTAALFLAYNVTTIYRDQRKNSKAAPQRERQHESGDLSSSGGAGALASEYWFLAVLGAVVLAAFLEGLSYQLVSSRTPFVIMAPLLALLAWHALRLSRGQGIDDPGGASRLTNAKIGSLKKVAVMAGLMALMLMLITVLGHYVGIFICGLALMRFTAKEELLISVAAPLLTAGLIFLVFEYGFDIDLYDGLLFRYFAGYRDF